jgi:hypothetical protein
LLFLQSHAQCCSMNIEHHALPLIFAQSCINTNQGLVQLSPFSGG